MPSCLIADDEPHLAAFLRTELAGLWPDLQVVHVARNGVEAAREIAAREPDIAFLDIKMPGLTGLEVAQGIEGPTRSVFVTAYDEFAVQAFEQEAVDYLLKPVKRDRLAQTVERLRRALAASSAPETPALDAVLRRLAQTGTGATTLRYVRAGQGELTRQIDVADVLFFRADDKYTCVQTDAGEHLIRTPIAELAAQLDGEQFWQVHRSTIVNLRHVAGTRRDEQSRLFVRLHGWQGELPISRAYVHRFKAM